MNKKFLSGAIFGLSLGLCIGIATPMIGATNKAKDIVINKSSKSFKSNSISTPTAAKAEVDENKDIKEAVSVLKEINTKLKENGSQNEDIIRYLKVLISRSDVNPMPDPNEKK